MKTLKEKIEVMQAALDGEEVEYQGLGRSQWYKKDSYNFQWGDFDYRIKQKQMEFWVNIFDDEAEVFMSEEGAKEHEKWINLECKTIKVVEVIE